MSLGNRVLLFSAKAFAALIVLAALWCLIASAYDSLLVAVANRVSPTAIELVSGHRIALYHHQGNTEGIGTPYLHSGLILVVALILASPGLGLWRRFRFLMIASVLVFAAHVVTITALAGHPLEGDDPVVVLLLPIGSSLLPALVWGAFSVKYWFAGLESGPYARSGPGHRRRTASKAPPEDSRGRRAKAAASRSMLGQHYRVSSARSAVKLSVLYLPRLLSRRG